MANFVTINRIRRFLERNEETADAANKNNNFFFIYRYGIFFIELQKPCKILTQVPHLENGKNYFIYDAFAQCGQNWTTTKIVKQQIIDAKFCLLRRFQKNMYMTWTNLLEFNKSIKSVMSNFTTPFHTPNPGVCMDFIKM